MQSTEEATKKSDLDLELTVKLGLQLLFAQCCYMLNMKVVESAASTILTCWKESSNNVCLETVIFTWLGRAFD